MPRDPAQGPQDGPVDGGTWFALGLILVIALVLRLPGLGGPLWFDEVITVETHLRSAWSAMMQDYSMNHHYLFNLQSKLAIGVFGETAWAVRLPALLFGVGTVAAIWALARHVAGTGMAHAAALLVALSYHQIWFSQNARGYTEMAFWGTLGTLAFIRGMERPAARIWILYALALALAVFTHLTAAFLFAAHGLVWLYFLLRGARDAAAPGGRMARLVWPVAGFGIGGLLTLVLYAPLLPSLLATVGGVSATSAVDEMQEYQSPLWTLAEGLRTGLGSGGPLVALVAIAVLAVAILGARLALRRRQGLLPAIVAVHVLLTIVLLSALGMRIWPRFFFADIGFLLILLVMGTRELAGFLSARLKFGLSATSFYRIGIITMVCISAALALRVYAAPKQDLAGAVAWVAANRQADERVYALGHGAEAFRGYFAQGDWQPVMTEAEYQAAMALPGPLMLVVAFPDRAFRMATGMGPDRDTGILQEALVLPGTLGDGYVLILRRP